MGRAERKQAMIDASIRLLKDLGPHVAIPELIESLMITEELAVKLKERLYPAPPEITTGERSPMAAEYIEFYENMLKRDGAHKTFRTMLDDIICMCLSMDKKDAAFIKSRKLTKDCLAHIQHMEGKE